MSYPEPTVGAFIFNPKGELLLIKSHKWGNLYVVPGGHIEIGETIEEALRRESLEETGLQVHNPKFICYWDVINHKEYFKQKHMIFFNFSLRTKSDQVKLNDEAESFVWVKPPDALKLPLESYTKKTIEQYLLTRR